MATLVTKQGSDLYQNLALIMSAKQSSEAAKDRRIERQLKYLDSEIAASGGGLTTYVAEQVSEGRKSEVELRRKLRRVGMRSRQINNLIEDSTRRFAEGDLTYGERQQLQVNSLGRPTGDTDAVLSTPPADVNSPGDTITRTPTTPPTTPSTTVLERIGLQVPLASLQGSPAPAPTPDPYTSQEFSTTTYGSSTPPQAGLNTTEALLGPQPYSSPPTEPRSAEVLPTLQGMSITDIAATVRPDGKAANPAAVQEFTTTLGHPYVSTAMIKAAVDDPDNEDDDIILERYVRSQGMLELIRAGTGTLADYMTPDSVARYLVTAGVPSTPKEATEISNTVRVNSMSEQERSGNLNAGDNLPPTDNTAVGMQNNSMTPAPGIPSPDEFTPSPDVERAILPEPVEARVNRTSVVLDDAVSAVTSAFRGNSRTGSRTTHRRLLGAITNARRDTGLSRDWFLENRAEMTGAMEQFYDESPEQAAFAAYVSGNKDVGDWWLTQRSPTEAELEALEIERRRSLATLSQEQTKATYAPTLAELDVLQRQADLGEQQFKVDELAAMRDVERRRGAATMLQEETAAAESALKLDELFARIQFDRTTAGTEIIRQTLTPALEGILAQLEDARGEERTQLLQSVSTLVVRFSGLADDVETELNKIADSNAPETQQTLQTMLIDRFLRPDKVFTFSTDEYVEGNRRGTPVRVVQPMGGGGSGVQPSDRMIMLQTLQQGGTPVNPEITDDELLTLYTNYISRSQAPTAPAGR